MIKNSISKRTEHIRYKFVFWIIRKMTPALHKKMNPKPLPRHSIKIMSKTFNNKLVKGVEIGVNRGDNAENILNQLNIRCLYLVDKWDNYEGLDTNRNQDINYQFVLERFKNNKKVKIIRAFSKDVANQFDDNSLDFVYIDGNHLYDYVYQDITLWTPKIKRGGFIAGHDVFHKENGVLKALKDYCFAFGILFHVENPDWYFIKKSEGLD